MDMYLLLAISTFGVLVSGAQAQGVWNGNPWNDTPARAGHFESVPTRISGVVLNQAGSPVSAAQIEVHDLQTGQTVASAYTNKGGQYELSFPYRFLGDYEVIAISGIYQDRRTFSERGDVTLNFRMPIGKDESAAANVDRVSVAELRVPAKAREALERAQAAENKNKRDEAGRYLSQALRIDPDFSEALTLRGLMRLQDNDADGAREDLEHAIQSDRSYATAYFVLGTTYNAQGHFDDALRVLQQGLAQAPESWQGHFESARAYYGKSDFTRALEQLAGAEHLAPTDFAPIHLLHGEVFLALANDADAAKELQTFLDRDPKDPKAGEIRELLAKLKAGRREGEAKSQKSEDAKQSSTQVLTAGF
jgi:tetratricopeptide (TPR) repeat protein